MKLQKYLVFVASLFLPCVGYTPDVRDIILENTRDIILEFKGAYFLPINQPFKDIYKGGALFGPEVTARLYRQLYGFASVDYLTKGGYTRGLHTPTKMSMVPLGIGLKYLGRVTPEATLYAGLGFQPTYIQNQDALQKEHNWGFGGIVKAGAFIDLPHDFVLDIFIDYSFVDVKLSYTQTSAGTLHSRKFDLGGFIFGAGLGYRFD